MNGDLAAALTWSASDIDHLERAVSVAVSAHAGQRYSSPDREPYVLHPLRVMAAVDAPYAKMAAALHDVLEDTRVTMQDLEQHDFPPEVLRALDGLTRRPAEAYGDYIERLASDPIAVAVKRADLDDNLRNNLRLPDSASVRDRIDRYRRAIARLGGDA